MKRGKLMILAALAFAALATASWLSYPPARAAAPPPPPPEKTSNKWVPILTLGSSLDVGMAQVTGSKYQVKTVKAVAQLETDYKDMARIRILVPIGTKHVTKRLRRVPAVSVTGIGDYTIKK